jgi:hypothetical protein
VESQCWSVAEDGFIAPPELIERLRGHLDFWAARGVVVEEVRTAIRCTERLNHDRANGKNRFLTDLHAMEDLILAFRAKAGRSVLAVCGKVGGMDDYSRFFGPLSGHLHTELARGKALSAYHFPLVGEVRFLRDADGKDALVMLASLVGKYVRELFMARINQFYEHSLGPEPVPVSGDHDPLTTRFVRATELVRRTARVPDGCFERARDGT